MIKGVYVEDRPCQMVSVGYWYMVKLMGEGLVDVKLICYIW